MRIVVLGGGPGGYSAAWEAARLGADVTVVERERLGGTCVNWGCIPTKTILRSAHIVKDTNEAAEFGLVATKALVDVVRLRERKEAVVDELVSQLYGVARKLKVDVVHGDGRLAGPKTVEVDTAEGQLTIEADAVVLATGSVPCMLPCIDHSLERVWTSDDATSLHSIPKEIIIIGAGVIGLEFACAYATFGSTVTVVELTPTVMPGNDKRVQREAQKALEGLGVKFLLGDAVEGVEQVGDRVKATLRSGGALEADILMSAPGRVPNGNGFGFAEAGVAMDRAAVIADDGCRTNVDGVFAIGDLIGGMMLAHVAEVEGEVAAKNAVAYCDGRDQTATVCSRSTIPACVYTFPEIGVVGSSRDSAKERGEDAVQVVMKFAGNGKALAEGEGDGWVQIVAENGTGRIMGCQIVGPHATEIIHEISLPMALGVTVGDLGHKVFAHPTVSEVVKFACIEAARKTGTGH